MKVKQVVGLLVLLLVALLTQQAGAQAVSNAYTLTDVHQYVVNTAGDYKGAIALAQQKYDLLVQEQKAMDKNEEAIQAEIKLIEGILAHVNEMTTQSSQKQQIITLLQGLRKDLLASLPSSSRYNLVQQAKEDLEKKTSFSGYIDGMLKAIADAMAELNKCRSASSTCTSSSGSSAAADVSLGASTTTTSTPKTPEANIKYFLSNGVDVTNPTGVKVVGNTIVKTATESAWNSGCTSSKTVTDKGDNRGIYFEAASSDAKLIVGLSRTFGFTNPNNIEYAVWLLENGDVQVSDKATVVTVSRYAAGDFFSIDYRNGQIEVTQNSLSIFSSSISPSFPLVAVVAMFTPGASIKNLLFTKERPSVDSAIPVPNQPVLFKNIYGLGCDWGKVVKTSPISSDWYSGAFSVQKITGDTVNGVEFTAMQTDKSIMIGLSSLDINNGGTGFSIDYSIYFMNNGYVSIYERGTGRGTFMAYNVGDKFSIVIDELGAISYRKEGVPFYTSFNSPTLPLYVDTNALTTGAGINNIKFIVAEAVQHIVDVSEYVTFRNLAGVAAIPGRIQRVGMANDELSTGAFGVSPIDPTTSAVKGFAFRAGQTNALFAIGLSSADNTVSYASIEFGFLFYPDGYYLIYEKGNDRGMKISYGIEDQFALVIRYNQVHYLKNGKVFYISEVVPKLPLYVDVSLGTRGSVVKEIRYITDAQEEPTKLPNAGDKVYFTSAQGFLTGPGYAEKVSTVNFQASARSYPTITKNGNVQGIEFKCKTTYTESIVALTNTVGVYEFGINCRNGFITIFEKSIVGTIARFTESDVLGIRINQQGKIEYTKNGRAFTTSLNIPTLPLMVAHVSTTEGSIIDEVKYVGPVEAVDQKMTPGSVVYFKDFRGASTTPNNGLVLVVATNYQNAAGAVSYLPITETTEAKGIEATLTSKQEGFIGLSTTAVVDGYYKYPYAININNSPYVNIYENGASITSVPVGLGDKIGIAVRDGKVVYLKNDAVVYTSKNAPVYPLYTIFHGSGLSFELSDIKYTK